MFRWPRRGRGERNRLGRWGRVDVIQAVRDGTLTALRHMLPIGGCLFFVVVVDLVSLRRKAWCARPWVSRSLLWQGSLWAAVIAPLTHACYAAERDLGALEAYTAFRLCGGALVALAVAPQVVVFRPSMEAQTPSM